LSKYDNRKHSSSVSRWRAYGGNIKRTLVKDLCFFLVLHLLKRCECKPQRPFVLWVDAHRSVGGDCLSLQLMFLFSVQISGLNKSEMTVKSLIIVLKL